MARGTIAENQGTDPITLLSECVPGISVLSTFFKMGKTLTDIHKMVEDVHMKKFNKKVPLDFLHFT